MPNYFQIGSVVFNKKIFFMFSLYTVKTLYNVTLYNRIFNIGHKFAGNGSVSITNPSL